MSVRKPFLLLALVVTASLVAGGCGGSDKADSTETAQETTKSVAATSDAGKSVAAGSTLTASVGPGFEISLSDPDGNPVTKLAPGKYTINVEDKSSSHNFHLTGSGVDESTEVGEETTDTWNVEFAAGDYTFQCDPHASSMNGSFTVA